MVWNFDEISVKKWKMLVGILNVMKPTLCREYWKVQPKISVLLYLFFIFTSKFFFSIFEWNFKQFYNKINHKNFFNLRHFSRFFHNLSKVLSYIFLNFSQLSSIPPTVSSNLQYLQWKTLFHGENFAQLLSEKVIGSQVYLCVKMVSDFIAFKLDVFFSHNLFFAISERRWTLLTHNLSEF